MVASRRFWTLAVLLTLTIATAACATRTVGHVLADPGRYRDRTVSLRGDVVESYSLLGRGFYRIEDHTGDLWVFADRGVPRQGARVRVSGTIQDGFNLGGLEGALGIPEPVRSRIANGLLMLERDRDADY